MKLEICDHYLIVNLKKISMFLADKMPHQPTELDYNEKSALDIDNHKWKTNVNKGPASGYEYQCWLRHQDTDPDVLSNKLLGATVHPRIHLLENGLVYLTIHQDDGTEIFDFEEYQGWEPHLSNEYEKLGPFSEPVDKRRYAVGCQPTMGSPLVLSGFGLGDDFAFSEFLRSSLISPQRPTSLVTKGYKEGEVSCKTSYNITPPTDHYEGKILFKHQHLSPYAGIADPKNMVMRRVYVTIYTSKKDWRYCDSLVIVNFFLKEKEEDSNNLGIVFNFDWDGSLNEIRPSLHDYSLAEVFGGRVIDSIEQIEGGRGKNSDIALVTQSFLGRDITGFRHDAVKSLVDLLGNAKQNSSQDPNELLSFVEN